MTNKELRHEDRLIFEAYENSNKVQLIVRMVEEHLGDVVEDPESEQASEECWTLAIDAAHELGLDGEDATISAKAACKQLGYPRPDDNDEMNITLGSEQQHAGELSSPAPGDGQGMTPDIEGPSNAYGGG